MTFGRWMKECKALVRHPEVWGLIAVEWDWPEAYDTGFAPTRAVHCALLDVLAPDVGASWIEDFAIYEQSLHSRNERMKNRGQRRNPRA